jgi:hypothetical protein
MLRSLALPGWGQFYNRRPVKGALIAAAETASAAAFFVRRRQLADEVVPAGQAPKRNLFLLTTIGVLFYSAVDAFVDAHLDGVNWGAVRAGPEGADLVAPFRIAGFELRVRAGPAL